MPVAQFSGLASGIDSAALIDAIIQARELKNEIARENISALEGENSALDELNTKMLALDELVGRFRSSNGGGVSKKASSTAPTIATASASTSATNATYALNVLTLAKAASGSFNEGYSSADAVVSASSGQVNFVVGNAGEQVSFSVNVTGGSTTLTQLANAISEAPQSEGRLTASVVNIGTNTIPDYRLVVNTLNTGKLKSNLAITADPALTELQDVTISQAENAQFQMDGITGTITRYTNSVSDVVSGLTFNLSGTGAAQITVSNDVDSTSDRLKEIVEAYNDIVKFINENDLVTQSSSGGETQNVFGSLAKTRIDDDFLAAFRRQLLETRADEGTVVTSLAELGFITNRDGTITFNEENFKKNAEADATGATQVLRNFADSTTGVQGMIYQYTRLAGFIDTAQDSNRSEIELLNKQIENVERQSEKIKQSLTLRFANLESVTARLQNQQQALSGVLAGL